ncbi:hypothetical protein CMV_003853 [Castanea mollissima]|uniref:Uncharacterized protein n=1 Tax=Castanea mollissima TaxID=60419 RepID=A0A8J4RZ60_9ROSI|nr:hypothetical protein CMV_003853 [Castanea mollissima]
MSTSISNTPLLPHVPWNYSFPLAAWSIWSARNKLIMEEQPFVVQLILKKIKALSLYTFHILPARNPPVKNSVVNMGWTPLLQVSSNSILTDLPVVALVLRLLASTEASASPMLLPLSFGALETA